MGRIDTLPAVVYRMRAADGTLLYVGCSIDLLQRLNQHDADKPWWPEVATVEVEHHDTRSEALRAEARAIVTERPVHCVRIDGADDQTRLDREAARDADHTAFRECVVGFETCPVCSFREADQRLGGGLQSIIAELYAPGPSRFRNPARVLRERTGLDVSSGRLDRWALLLGVAPTTRERMTFEPTAAAS